MSSRTTSQGSGDPEPVRGDGWTLRAALDYVQVQDRLIPEWLELEIDGDDAQPTSFGRVEVRNGVPEVVELRFVSTIGQREIRQADLRGTQVASLVEFAAGYAVFLDELDGSVRFGEPEFEASLAAVLQARRGNGVRSLNAPFLERVAAVYKANIDSRPTQAVRNHFVVSERTASEYVQRARRAGLLPPTSPGKKRA